MKDPKQSTKQRFVAIDFTYPAWDAETAIAAREASVEARTADKPGGRRRWHTHPARTRAERAGAYFRLARR
ncbi:MAG: hypothetical protein ACRYHQ_02280 [Janthinobacterium lividum]